MGSRLIALLLKRGHSVRALTRPGSAHRVPAGGDAVIGDALDRTTYGHRIAPADTLVHLVGVPHPSPAKAALFRSIDLASVRESAAAAAQNGIRHFVYVSVAQPAPIMREYVNARAEGEMIVKSLGLPATFIRPWYVLGPGHRWPYVLVPVYWALERFPGTRDNARRLGLVTIAQMISTLVDAVESPPHRGARIVEVPEIRSRRSAVSAGMTGLSTLVE